MGPVGHRLRRKERGKFKTQVLCSEGPRFSGWQKKGVRDVWRRLDTVIFATRLRGTRAISRFGMTSGKWRWRRPTAQGSADGDRTKGMEWRTQKRFARGQRWRRLVRGRPWPGDDTTGPPLLPAGSCLWRRAPFRQLVVRADHSRNVCACWRAAFFFFCRSAHALASRERDGPPLRISWISRFFSL